MNLARVGLTHLEVDGSRAVSPDDLVPFVLETEDGVAMAEPPPALSPMLVERRSGREAVRAVTSTARRALSGVRGLLGDKSAKASAHAVPDPLSPLLERVAEARPDDAALRKALADLRRAQFDAARSAKILAELLPIFSRLGEADAFAYCCRKLDRLTASDPVARYRDLAALYSRCGRFEAAAAACRIAVECLLDDGHTGAAVRFVNNMPSLGSIETRARAQLLRLVERAIEIHRVAPASEATPVAEGETKPQPVSFLNPAIFLVGRLGSVSLFDIVQIVENNALTGRFELQSESGCGAFHFVGGLIVAALFEGETGFEAAKSLVQIERATFQVIRSELVGDDGLEVTSNTGFLMSVLCKIDEEQLADDAGGGEVDGAMVPPVH